MLRLTAIFTTVIGLFATALTAQATAQACEGRPGASAIEQYCEAIPDGTGASQRPATTSTTQSNGSGVSSTTSKELEDSGQDGQAVLGLVASGGGSGGSGEGSSSKSDAAHSGGTSDSGASSAADTTAASSPSDNPLKAVSSSVSNGSTVGSGFLWGLLALAVAAAAAAWVGFRRSHQPPTEQ